MTTTSFATKHQRNRYTSTAAINSQAGVRGSGNQFWRGDAAGFGGFYVEFQFHVVDTLTAAKNFIGLSSGGGVITLGSGVEVSSKTNIVGIGADTTDTNFQFMHNDGSGAANRIDLGASFPANTAETAVYNVQLFCLPNGSEIKYRVERLDSAAIATGTLTTDIPVSATFLCWHVLRDSAANASATIIDFHHMYAEVFG
jgi:hypothetical protein